MGFFDNLFGGTGNREKRYDQSKILSNMSGKRYFFVSARRRDDPEFREYFYYNPHIVTLDEINIMLQNHVCDSFHLDLAYGVPQCIRITAFFRGEFANMQPMDAVVIRKAVNRNIPMKDHLQLLDNVNLNGRMLFYVTSLSTRSQDKEMYWPNNVLSLNEFNAILAKHICFIEDVKYEYTSGNAFFALVLFRDDMEKRNLDAPFIHVKVPEATAHPLQFVRNDMFYEEVDYSKENYRGDQMVYATSFLKDKNVPDFFYEHDVLSHWEYEKLLNRDRVEELFTKTFHGKVSQMKIESNMFFSVLRFH